MVNNHQSSSANYPSNPVEQQFHHDRLFASGRYTDADILRLADFFRNNPHPTLVFNPVGEVIKVNPSAQRLLRHLSIQSDELLPAEHVSIVQTCLSQHQTLTCEVRVGHSLLALAYAAIPSFQLVYLYAIDLTEYRKAEDHLLQAISAALSLTRMSLWQQAQHVKSHLLVTLARQPYAQLNPSAPEFFVAIDGGVFCDGTPNLEG